MCHHPRPRSEKRDDHPHTCVHDRDSLSLSTAFLLHASNMTATHHIIIVQNHQVGSLIISSFDSSCYDDMIFHTVPARTRVAHPRSLGSYVLIPINGERDCSFCFVTVPIDPAVLWTQHRESTSPPRRRGRRSRLVLCFGWPITFLVQSTLSTNHPESMPRGDPQFCFYGDSNRLRRIPDIGSFSIFSQ